MKKLLIVSFDLEVGGVERSLISLLHELENAPYQIDLFLYRHSGEFMEFIPKHVNLLPEIKEYTSFRKTIKTLFKESLYQLGTARLIAKFSAEIEGKKYALEEPGYRQMQNMWRRSLKYLPMIEGHYDTAVSYLWPHYTVAEKVTADNKAAWIHTDFSTVEVNPLRDEMMWKQFDSIVAVSESCRKAFISVYPLLTDRTCVVENMSSASGIQAEAEKMEAEEMEGTEFKIVTVARLSHAKGIDLAIEAVKLLEAEELNEFIWYIVGFGGEEDKLKQQIKAYGLESKIIFLGKKVNPYPYLKKADLYVQPSRYEGKAVTVTEAQIMGLPVLITNYATAASQVVHGETGWVTTLSPEGIAEGIKELKSNAALRKSLKKGCREYDFSPTKDISRFHELVGGNA